MKRLGVEDQRFVEAATGWLGLGSWRDANEELESITASMRAHPDVLRVRFEIYAAAGNWPLAAEVTRTLTEILPEDPLNWIHYACSLHAMKRTQDAFELLLPVVNRFSKEYRMRYNLACYACQLGKIAEAMTWLEEAVDLAGVNDIRLKAIDDPELEPLWNQIGEI